jgi:thiol-disulfide isomerase/thioredoxin
MQELNQDNLNEVLQSNSKVIVQYGAAWCGACKLVKPSFQRLSTENENVTFVYVDAENFPNSRELANVENLPTFAGFIDGKLVKQSAGTKIESIEGVLNEITGN